MTRAAEEGVIYFALGLYLKYCTIERLVRRHLGEVEHYQLLFADPARLDVVVELALPKQYCSYGLVRADGASLAQEAQRLCAHDLLPIGSLHKHPINKLSATDVSLLDENLALEMAPALLRPFETRTDCPEAKFELTNGADLLIDGQPVPLEQKEDRPRCILLRRAQAIRTGYRARVFCLATNGGPRPRFHGEEMIVVRTAECPTAHSYRREIRQVLLISGPPRLPADEESLEREILEKLSVDAWAYGYDRWGWKSSTWRH